jgi:hypothetical protein
LVFVDGFFCFVWDDVFEVCWLEIVVIGSLAGPFCRLFIVVVVHLVLIFVVLVIIAVFAPSTFAATGGGAT